LYFTSDTPELGVGDEILDDPTDTIHLVYLHGSIHRRSQAASDENIQALKEKNAQTLAPVLKRHGVIVLGYSGWDDAVVEALAACDRFDHRLYWCGLEPDPLAAGAFGPRVSNILRKPAALYVQILGAGRFMAQLCSQLVEGGARLLDNPIGQLRELLDTIDLKELEDLKPPVSAGSNIPQLLDIGSSAKVFVRAMQLTLQRLEHAEQVFLRQTVAPPPVKKSTSEIAGQTPSEQRERDETVAAPVELKSKPGNCCPPRRLLNVWAITWKALKSLMKPYCFPVWMVRIRQGFCWFKLFHTTFLEESMKRWRIGARPLSCRMRRWIWWPGRWGGVRG
jgi:hypothetical protein